MKLNLMKFADKERNKVKKHMVWMKKKFDKLHPNKNISKHVNMVNNLRNIALHFTAINNSHIYVKFLVKFMVLLL